MVARLGNGAGSPIGLLGHFDTVFPAGTLARNPFTIREGRAYGPGVLDMKGGVTILLYVIRALRAAGYAGLPLKVILAGDEEVAHMQSEATALIRAEAKECLAALNFETGYPDNSLVVGRKGGGTYVMEAHGVASHAGIAPEKGRSAILELAHKIIDIQALSDPASGTTFNVGTIKGGTTSNTVPDFASMKIDVRCTQIAAEADIAACLKAVAAKTYVEGVRTTLTGGLGFAPMETTPEVMQLFDLVVQTSAELGFSAPRPMQSGGGSDAANTVAAGVPTVCALGVKGEKNHTLEEYALVDSLFERCKLAVACILRINADAGFLAARRSALKD